jgi:hypothetical protein
MASRALTRWTALLLGSVFLVSSAACHSATTPTPTLTTDSFSGTLDPGGTAYKYFDVNYGLYYSDGSLTVTSLTKASDNSPVDITVGVGFGTPAFDGTCTRSATYSASTAKVGQELPASGIFIGPQTYCFQIYDAGTLTETLNWTVAVKHY